MVSRVLLTRCKIVLVPELSAVHTHATSFRLRLQVLDPDLKASSVNIQIGNKSVKWNELDGKVSYWEFGRSKKKRRSSALHTSAGSTPTHLPKEGVRKGMDRAERLGRNERSCAAGSSSLSGGGCRRKAGVINHRISILNKSKSSHLAASPNPLALRSCVPTKFRCRLVRFACRCSFVALHNLLFASEVR